MEVVLLAPGESMSQALADSMRGRFVGVVTSCFPLAPRANFLAANDRHWWTKYPDARKFEGRKFSANRIAGVEKLEGAVSNWNSGVLALEAAVYLGATSIRLYGFDMRGTHFFGPYVNGLRNTTADSRRVHRKQYAVWAKRHPQIDVINCTPGSALGVFPMEGDDAQTPAQRNVA